jgi:prevent-host-death family protein
MCISATEFRKNFFRILDEVEQTQSEVVITKRGKAIAKLVFMQKSDQKDPLLGALTGLGRTVGDLTEPLIDKEAWELD